MQPSDPYLHMIEGAPQPFTTEPAAVRRAAAYLAGGLAARMADGKRDYGALINAAAKALQALDFDWVLDRLADLDDKESNATK